MGSLINWEYESGNRMIVHWDNGAVVCKLYIFDSSTEAHSDSASVSGNKLLSEQNDYQSIANIQYR